MSSAVKTPPQMTVAEFLEWEPDDRSGALTCAPPTGGAPDARAARAVVPAGINIGSPLEDLYRGLTFPT